MPDANTQIHIKSLLSAFFEMKAENDDYLRHNFANTFVHTAVYSQAQLEGKSILIGGKGSGKTAILIANETEHAKRYAAVAHVSLDDMPFTALFNFFYRSYTSALSSVQEKYSDVSDILEIEKVTCYAWRNALLALVLLRTADSLLTANDLTDAERYNVTNVKRALERQAQASLEAEPLLPSDSPLIYAFLFLFFTLLQQEIEDLVNKDAPNIAVLLARITQKLLKTITQPTQPDLEGHAAIINAILTRIDKKVFLALDKFDDYYDKFYKNIREIKPQQDGAQEIVSRKAFLRSLLEGLVLAARDIKTYPAYERVETLFAIPLDKFVELELRERMDLERRRVIPIRWSPKELFHFVNRRIHTALALKTQAVDQAWYEIFPRTVHNGATKQPEDSFLYFARHSLCKPRELQMHVYYALKRLETNGGDALDEDQIRESITESCGAIIRQEFLEEFSREYQGLPALLTQLVNAKLKTVMAYSDVCDIVHGIKLSEDISTPDAVLQRLYKMGIVGARVIRPVQELLPSPTVKQNGQHVAYRFYYNYPDTEPFAPNSIVLFHPMFTDYIGAEHHEDYIINELRWDMFK
jgi:hypothetical protein